MIQTFNRGELYYLPKLDCKVKFIEKSNSTYSIDFFKFEIASGVHLKTEVMLLNGEVQKIV
jgi:hypothetical protein